MNNNIDSINFGTCSNVIFLPAIEYLSGDRVWYAIAMNYSSLAKFVDTTGIKKKNVEIIGQQVRNRFLDSKHKNGIKEYIKEEAKFTIPPITLVSSGILNFKPYTFNGHAPSLEEAGSRAGVIALPINYKFECLDGNHRCVAIKELAEERIDRIENSSILLNIVVENDIKKIRQDFVDVNKNAKPTTASINTLFDTRDKTSELVVSTVDNNEFLSNCTELLATTISKNSKSLYTINNIRNAMIELCDMNSQSSPKAATKKLSEKLKSESNYKDIITRKTELFFKYLEQNKEIVEYRQNVDSLTDIQRIRTKSLLTSGSGIVIAARVANHIFNKYNHETIEKELEKLFSINWQRSNDLFQGIIILYGNKILKSRHSINETAELLIELIS